MKKRIAFALIALALAFAACEGPTGPQGPAGPAGAGGNPIPGTVTLSGAPMVGVPVIAFYDDPDHATELGWQWYADGTYLQGGAGLGMGSTTIYIPETADTGKALTCRVYALGYTGYVESAPVTITPFAAPAAPTALTAGYVTGTLTATDVHWYSFNASGGSYTIEWEHGGTGGTTAYISVSAYQSDGTPFSPGVGTIPISGYSGPVYVNVVPSMGITGTYHIRYQ